MRLHVPLMLLALAGDAALSAQQSRRWTGPGEPVYVVTRNRYASDFTPDGPTARFGDLIMIQIWSPRRRQADNYKIGERAGLFADGERVGSVKIARVAGLQCNSSAALVSADSGFRFSKTTLALATSAQEVRPHPSARREPTLEERAHAVQIAISEFRKLGFAAAAARRARVEHLDTTNVDGSGKRWMVGSAVVTTGKARHQLFFVARGDNAESTIELSHYHRTKDLGVC